MNGSGESRALDVEVPAPAAVEDLRQHGDQRAVPPGQVVRVENDASDAVVECARHGVGRRKAAAETPGACHPDATVSGSTRDALSEASPTGRDCYRTGASAVQHRREAARGRQGDAARAGYRALGAAFGGCLRWLAARVRPSLLVSRNCIPRAGRIRRNVRARPRERVHRVVSSRPAVRADTPRAPTGLARTRRAAERRLLRCVTGAADAPEGRW